MLDSLISKISINSSSKSSTSSAIHLKNIIDSWEEKTIASCILGISKIGIVTNIDKDFSHAALLLLDKTIDYDEDDFEKIQDYYGILIEYGDYNPNMCDDEKNYVKKELVKYHYDDKGGLRYYGKKYGEFCTEFGSLGYIDCNIKPDNQQSFEVFLNNIAKKEDNKWIQKNYFVGIKNNFNCQNFAIEALKKLKPYFTLENIIPNNKDPKKLKGYNKKIESFVPQIIRPELKSFYTKI